MKIEKSFTILLGAILASIITATSLYAVETKLNYGGYIKLDVNNSYYHDGYVSPLNPLRDFHLPATIPVGQDLQMYQLDYHVKESRFNLMTLTTLDDGRRIKGFLEMDFLLSVGGDERVSNSFNPRMRHFYFATGPFLFGQTWTTFMIVILPDDLDFVGAAEGVVFGRQPQLRLSYKGWQLSLENPETTVSLFDGGGRMVCGASRFPDVIARRNFSSGSAALSIAGIVRQLQNRDEEGNLSDREYGYGLTIGQEARLGGDDLKFQGTVGRGLGRYVGLNFVNAAAVDTLGRMSTIDEACGFIAYRHFWTKKLRSTIDVSAFWARNPVEITGGTVNKEAQSASINLLWSPVNGWTVGMEYMRARRVLEDDTEGQFDRVQLSARWDFGYLSK